MEMKDRSPSPAWRCVCLFAVTLAIAAVGATAGADGTSAPRAQGASKPRPVHSKPSAADGAQVDPELICLFDELAQGGTLRKEASEGLREKGSAVVPEILARIAGGDFLLRWDLVNLLGYARDPRAIAELVHRATADAERHVRWRALWALKETDPRGTVAMGLFLKEIDNPDREISHHAVVGLGFFGDLRAVAYLHRALADDDPMWRWEALYNLRTIHDETTSRLVEPILHGGESELIRREVFMVLSNICDANAIELLREAIDDGDPGVRWRAVQGLTRCRDKASYPLLLKLEEQEQNQAVCVALEAALAEL